MEADQSESDREDLWREYEVLAQLFQSYLSILVSAATGFFLIAGGIVTFVLASGGDKIVDYALFVPIGMSLLFATAMLVVFGDFGELELRLNELQRKLGVGLAPHTRLLKWGIVGVGGLCLLSLILTTALLIVLQT